jgi:hypothetical protein
MPGYTDHMGLVLTTDSGQAAACYARGLELLVTSRDARVMLRAALAADPSLGVALAALVWSATIDSAPSDLVAALERRLAEPAVATRRERQHMEIVAIAARGDRDRARALGLDHLREFPQDVLVAHLIGGHVTPAGSAPMRVALSDETGDDGVGLPSPRGVSPLIDRLTHG